jgi:photosystem II stability/assembly factor-like uncharacterized protein
VQTLAIDPQNPNIIYGSLTEVFKSIDSGASWTEVGSSSSGILPESSLPVLAIDPINSNIVYAAGRAQNVDVVYKSTDAGGSWNASFFASGGVVRSLVIDPENTNIVYVGFARGLFKSLNGGTSWTTFDSGLPRFAVDALVLDPHNPGTLYAGIWRAGVFKSINGGSWFAANSGMTDSDKGIGELVIDPVNPTVIYVGTLAGNGVFKTTDGGATWLVANTGLAGGVSSLESHPLNSKVYAIGSGPGGFISNDNGASWLINYFYPLALDPHNENIVYAGFGRLFKSTDGGSTWILAETGIEGFLLTLAIDHNNSEIIYAGSTQGIFKTTNGGESWSPIVNAVNPFFQYPVSLVIDPNASNIIYALAINLDITSGNPSVYKSIDSGVTWSGPKLLSALALKIDPLNTQTLYASGNEQIFKSTDGGENWISISAGLPSGRPHVVADPIRPNVIYAGIDGAGVFRSPDGGVTWNPFSDGLTNLEIKALVIGGSGTFLHVGTPDGVFDCQLQARPVQLSAATYSAGEGDGSISINFTRTGNSAGAATVNYTTSDTAGLSNCNVVNGVASSRCDYTTAAGTARFAAGETTKTISIPIVDDAYAESDENLTITLSNPTGAELGPLAIASITIQDNDPMNGLNPLHSTAFFVRQQYLDFLNREPDPAGDAAWQAVINGCSPGDTSCDRIHVSSSFFRSPEFQGRGYFVYRFYPVAFGRKPDYDEFSPDLAKVGGFLSDAQLEAAKQAFIAEFMSRPAFVAKFNGLSNTEYVDALLTTAQVTSPNRDFWIAALFNGTRTRATVLRDISESPEVYNKYYNQAFVVMQYFGYLRREPDALYLNWIAQLDATGDYRSMIDGFMNSPEYRARFGP